MNTALSIIGMVFTFIINVIGDFLNALMDALQKQEGFNAQFGSESEIASRFDKGFLVSKHRRTTRRKAFENLLVSGPTGSGKTTRILLPNCYVLNNASMIINDPSKEIFLKSSGFFSQRGKKVLNLNYTDSSISCGFNMLSRIQKPNDINKIAHLLVTASLDKGGSRDPFWSLQSKSIIQIFIRLVLHQQEEFRNMANVLHVLKHFAADPKKVDAWIAKTSDELLVLDYKALIATPEKTLQNIVASAKSALQLFDDPEIAKTTAFDSINFKKLRETETVLFLHNSISDQAYISTLNSIFFEQFYGYVLQDLPKKSDLDLFVILEEGSSLYIPLLPLALANCRKVRTGTMFCVQALSQVKSMYRDEAENIISNCVTKIFLPGQSSLETLKELETIGGKCIYKDDKGMERVKPLISIDQIRLLEKHRTLLLSSNAPLIKGRTRPYYRSFKFNAYSKIEPVALSGDIPHTPLQLMQ